MATGSCVICFILSVARLRRNLYNLYHKFLYSIVSVTPFYRYIVLMVCTLAICVFYPKSDTNVVHVYTWYDSLPKEIINQFTQDTGIKVVYDFFDSNDTLEVKLFTGRTGYDVVTPSAIPYLARGIAVGAYQRLDRKQLSNYRHLNTQILEKLRTADRDLDYAIPYGYGTHGLLYNKDIVEKLFSHIPDGYDLLFDPAMAKKLAPYGINWLEEIPDFLPMILGYLGFNQDTHDKALIQKAFNYLNKLRPYVKRFNQTRYINDLMIGEIAISPTPNHEAYRAMRDAEEAGVSLQFTIPKTENSLWMDVFAIPKDAPHVKNAHIFINYMLQPKIAAQVTQITLLPLALRGNMEYDGAVQKEEHVFLQDINAYHLHKKKDMAFQSFLMKMWTKLRLNAWQS